MKHLLRIRDGLLRSGKLTLQSEKSLIHSTHVRAVQEGCGTCSCCKLLDALAIDVYNLLLEWSCHLTQINWYVRVPIFHSWCRQVARFGALAAKTMARLVNSGSSTCNSTSCASIGPGKTRAKPSWWTGFLYRTHRTNSKYTLTCHTNSDVIQCQLRTMTVV